MTPVARWLSHGGGALLVAALAGSVQAQPEAAADSPEGEPGVGADATESEPATADGEAEPEGEPDEPAEPAGEAGEPEPGDGDGRGKPPRTPPGRESTAAAATASGGDGAATSAPVGEGSGPEPAAAGALGEHDGRFAFGTYGRVIAATDGSGRPGRDTDIVAHGSRLDLDNYVELELRREDRWPAVDADTRMVATLALGHPIFHYDGDFEARLAVRNLYLEEKGLGLGGLSVWMGSRMLRGDDIYLLDFWPLDNLNTVGGGVRYDVCGDSPAPPASAAAGADGSGRSEDEPPLAEPSPLPPPWCTGAQFHFGLAQPNNPFYQQLVDRPAPLNQFGAATVAVLDRQRWVFSLKLEQLLRFGGPEGIKLAAYGEAHSVPSAQRETAVAGIYEPLPADTGFVVGGQVGGFLGDRGTFLNLFVRYAQGLAAYGEFAMPAGLSVERSAAGAHEVLVATSGNWEIGPVAITLGGYLRSFRNANDELDFGDVDEGIVILRPHLFFLDWAGLGLEGSYQLQHRGVLTGELAGESSDPGSLDPLTASVYRIGVVPFLAPGGPGAFSRPWFYFTYVASFRDQGARLLYPEGDVFRIREIEHYAGFGAEWWFGSSSYGGN